MKTLPRPTSPKSKPTAMPPPPRSGGMTYEQYLVDSTIDPHTEWVDGQVVPTPGAGADGPPHSPRPGFMTYEQFLSDPTVEPHSEWLDGEVIPMPPLHVAQAYEDMFLATIVNLYVDLKQLGVVLREPFQMKLAAGLPGRAPDLIFVANRHRRRIRGTFLAGPADLVVEIVSPESQTRDRVHKFAEYEAGGVPEYWLVDPDRRTAYFFRRTRAGKYKPVKVGADGTYHSKAVAGFWLKVGWLWQRPSTMDVLRAWGVV